MKKVIISALSLMLTLQIATTSVFATPKNDNIENEKNNSKVIAIVDGVEITENDVDENGLINNDVFLNAGQQTSDIEQSNPEIAPLYSLPSVLYVSKGTNAMMIKKLVAPRFSQQTDLYYLNPSGAKDFAYNLTSSSNLSIIANNAVSIAIGLYTQPHVGAIWSAGTMMAALNRNTAKTSILNLANAGKSVEVKIIKSSYATLYAVNAWNGTSINTNITVSDGVKETVHYYKTK